MDSKEQRDNFFGLLIKTGNDKTNLDFNVEARYLYKDFYNDGLKILYGSNRVVNIPSSVPSDLMKYKIKAMEILDLIGRKKNSLKDIQNNKKLLKGLFKRVVS